jgi:hypothetical protein
MRRTIIVALVAAVVGALVATPIAVYASHSFNDVPDSNTFHEDIAWLADAGVTQGCNPPANTEFCPDDSVTRGQMAAFIKRLASNKVVQADTARTAEEATQASTAGNADRLDGYHASQLSPRAAENFNGSGGQLTPTHGNKGLEVQITAPARGMIVITGGVTLFNFGVGAEFDCWLGLDGSSIQGSFRYVWVGGDDPTTSCQSSAAAVVDAGTYTITLVEVDYSNPDISYGNDSLQAFWIPFDGTGNVPASVTQLGQTIEEATEAGPAVDG